MECRDVLVAEVARLSGEPVPVAPEPLEAHLAVCASCRTETEALAATWDGLESDPDLEVSEDFRRDTLEKMAAATIARRGSGSLAVPRNIVAFRPRSTGRILLQAATLLLAAGAGYFAARVSTRPILIAGGTGISGTGAVVPERIPVTTERTVDVSRSLPDLSTRPKLANVAYKAADPAGRIGVSFDVTTRYTLVGRPEERGLAELLAYLVSGAGETAGARGRAIDLVSQHVKEASPASPQIVKVLAQTLKSDKNPGVRKKAADALAQLPPSPEIRDAFVNALKTDSNPAVRILAVEALARSATDLKDETTIQTLRDKAGDEGENGYIRGQAALALNRIRS
ncbi:MAG: HEAT repeat domain-containing protein [Thermoanaerobaculia bacterium]